MSRFWARINQGVEGPFDASILKYLEGFSPDTLVSGDDSAGDVWAKAGDVEELKELLFGSGKQASSGGPAAATLEETWALEGRAAETLATPQTMEEVWSLPDRTEARGPAGLEIVSDVPQADVIQFPERDAEPAPGPVLEVVPSREESVSQSDLLDVMEKFSNEIAPPPPPPAPKQEPQIVPEYPFKEEAEKLARKQSVAEKVRKLSKPLAALCAVSLLLALGAAGYNSARFQIWLASLKAKGAQAEPSPTAQVEKLPDLEPVVQAKTVSVNRVPAPKKTVPPPEPVPEVKKTVDPLEYQDYLLPGVKSPNVKEAAIEESPAEPAVEEPAPEPEIKIEEKKSGGGDKDSRQVEWMNQSGWGD